MTGAELIAAERQRQIDEEGWTPEHDKQHWMEELAVAASIYAMPERLRKLDWTGLPVRWPWKAEWFKPTPKDRVRELAKAGALIAAEMDRILALEDDDEETP